MSSEQWLDEVGREYLAQLQAVEPQFLIEIDVPDPKLKDIFTNLAKVAPYRWTPEKSICLALAAVHSAAQADKDQDSFREVFYARLDRKFYLTEWEEVYGPVISTFLKDWLSVDVPTSGPYRYVGAVYRHAGIPVPARAGFCQLVVRLLQDGLAFTRIQYTEAVRKVPSSVARHFLESDAGYEFTKQTARTIIRFDHGQISSNELEAFPPYRRSLYMSAIEALRGASQARRSSSMTEAYPRPTLGLDVTTRRLVIQFDQQGVNANVYRTEKGPVYYAQQAVAGTEPPVYLMKPESDWCKISPWWSPGQSQCALFRASDCSLVGDFGGVAPGRYYLATPVPESIPSDLILEEAVYLENDDADAHGLYYSIVFVDLPPGTTIPELSIFVKGTVAPPTLEFVNSQQLRLPLGINIFRGRLPSIRLLNWTANYLNKYWIWLNDQQGERRLDLTPKGRIEQIHVSCPSQGSIWLEQKNCLRDSSRTQRLTFAVIPEGIEPQVVEKCSALGSPAHLRVQMPQGWTFQPNPPMAKDTSGLWEIPSGERQVEGILSSGGFKLWVSLRVLRAAIHFQAPRGSGRVVWQEDALDELPVSIEGPSNVRCQILLEGDNETVLLSELGELNKSGVMRTTLRHFRDSLALSPLAAAEFHIQVGNYPSIPARHYFASAARISQCLPTEELNAVLFRLPDIVPALARAKELVDNPQVVFDSPSEFDVPDSLATLLCGLAYGAAKFDNAHLVDDVEAYKKHSPQFMCSVVDWLSKTEALVYSLGSEQELLKQFPEDAVSLVPVHRWQQALRDKKKWIQHNHDLPRLIREWRIAITCTDRDKDSELFNRNLGPQLTNAVRTYNDSFAAVGKATNQILTRAIIDLV